MNILSSSQSNKSRSFIMTFIKIYIAILCIATSKSVELKNPNTRKFPDKFLLGVATAAYQIEGGWNASDKGESIWDRFTHTTNLVTDRSNADVSCDSYNKHKRDVEMLVDLRVDFYRFSISWSRVLPDGFANEISKDGLRYYNELIDDLIAANITPWVTLYHWDLPQSLQDLGGWANPLMTDYFYDYAKVVFEAFGDRIKTWLTINEPWSACLEGYGDGSSAPGVNRSGIGEYICAHNMLKAHAAVYHLYDKVFRPTQKGRIGITLNAGWGEPTTKSTNDLQAANDHMQFTLGWFAHPIYSKNGDYPQVMKDKIAANSLEQGFPRSRLPEFTSKEIDDIKGTSDFFGLNHYSTYMIETPPLFDKTEKPDYWLDIGALSFQNQSWPSSASSWLRVVPWGFTKILEWIKVEYYNPEVIIFENGFSDANSLDDNDRISYFNQYLNAMLDAMENGCNVTSYTAWSLMDNFEWALGYTERFGLYYVDFNDSNRTRTPKKSALYYKKVLASRTIEKT